MFQYIYVTTITIHDFNSEHPSLSNLILNWFRNEINLIRYIYLLLYQMVCKNITNS